MIRWLKDKWQRDLVTLHEKREKERRERKILCPKCGYDVKILPDQPCPECGQFTDSGWRGRFGAGSPVRVVLLLYPAYMAGRSILMVPSMLVLPAIVLGKNYLPMMSDQPGRWVMVALYTTHWIVAVGVMLIVIRRRRWVMYGPRWYSVIVVAAALLLLHGTEYVAFRSFEYSMPD